MPLCGNYLTPAPTTATLFPEIDSNSNRKKKQAKTNSMQDTKTKQSKILKAKLEIEYGVKT